MTTIFNFTKITPNSLTASNKIATFLAATLGAPLVDTAVIKNMPAGDTLLIINGAFAFCKCLPALAVAVLAAKRIIWVQNDYTIVPPKPTSKGESPFRKAFVERRLLGLPDIDYWSTCSAQASATPHSHYVNWNSLTYQPTKAYTATINKGLYYGAYRQHREAGFAKYLTSDFVVSGPAKFAQHYHATVIPKLAQASFYKELGRYHFGLYIEDKQSHSNFHSPANRFYEMLSAGLPIYFQPEARRMLAEAGIDVSRYMLASAAEVPPLLARSLHKVAAEQREQWHRPYKELLKKQVQSLAKSEQLGYNRAAA